MSDTPTQIDTIIDTVAAGPRQAMVDGRSAVSQDLEDLLKIRNDRAAQLAAGNGNFGLRFTQLIPPGCG